MRLYDKFMSEKLDYKTWYEGHVEYINKELADIHKHFNVSKYIADFGGRADQDVLLSLLVMAFNEYNVLYGERDDFLARMLCVPIERIFACESKEYLELTEEDMD